jgi:mRNA interferase MazF
MQRGESWFASTPGGDRPLLVSGRIGSVGVAVLTPTKRGLVSELDFTPIDDGAPTVFVVNFDTLPSLPTSMLRHRVVQLDDRRMAQVFRALRDATGR